MKNIDFKVDLEDSLPANAFNSMCSEMKNAVLSSDQALDATSETTIDPNPTQLARALTQASLSAAYYTDSSVSANAVVLSVAGEWEQPNIYVLGSTYTFKAAIANTGASTINVAGIGVKSLLEADGSALTTGSLAVGGVYSVQYTTGDQFIIISRTSGPGIDSPGPVSSLRPVARYNMASSVTLASSGTFSIAQFNAAAIIDSQSNVVTGSSWAFNVTKQGYYRCSGQVTISGTSAFNGSTYFSMYIEVVGAAAANRIQRTTYPRSAEVNPSIAVNGIVFAGPGDIIRGYIAQNSGSTANLLAGAESSISIELVEFA